MKLKGHFETASDFQRESQAVLDSIKENYFHGAFEAWKERRHRCIRSQLDYLEGDGSQN
jgi:nicotinamide riboside kinase